MEEESKQLKLIKGELGGKKEKEPKTNKWFILLILISTLAVTLMFYFSAGNKENNLGSSKETREAPVFGGEKVYEF